MKGSQRRDVRYVVRFPAQLFHARQTRSLMTEDVSFNGVFLGTEDPPPVLQLVRVRLVLPIGDRALEAHGMTVHVVKAGARSQKEKTGAPAKTPGIGVQFYALDPDTRLTWDGFIRHVESRYPRSPDQAPLRLMRGSTPRPLSRRFERHTAVLKSTPVTLRDLEELYTREISQGTVELSTTAGLTVGDRVVVHVAHPVSGTPFIMEGTVLYGAGRGRPSPVTVELLRLEEGLREEFLDFMREGIIIEDERVEDRKE